MESIKQIITRSPLVRWLTQTETEFHYPKPHPGRPCVFDSENNTLSSLRWGQLGTTLQCTCGLTRFFPDGRF